MDSFYTVDNELITDPTPSTIKTNEKKESKQNPQSSLSFDTTNQANSTGWSCYRSQDRDKAESSTPLSSQGILNDSLYAASVDASQQTSPKIENQVNKNSYFEEG